VSHTPFCHISAFDSLPGLLLNHETPWQISDMNSHLLEFGGNAVFLGGERGADTMLMLHSHPEVHGARPVGNAGLMRGGLDDAADRVAGGALPADDFKFFYKVSEWLPGKLEEEVRFSLTRRKSFPHMSHFPFFLYITGILSICRAPIFAIYDTGIL